ncbi:MAG TPA: N-acetyltransferase [Pyrinomonadaceae bacterium]|jgi:ribosomal protein S18 acetylase RimI-like enzyme
MNQDWNIRLADERDVHSLVEFNRAMARETEAKDLDVEVLTAGVEGLLGNPRHGFYVVAEQGGLEPDKRVVAASLMVTFEWSDWRNGVFWWIQSVYVKPEFRRQGVYRALYQFVKSRAAAERGVRGFRLYVEKENHTAQQTYERLGMTETYYKMFEELMVNPESSEEREKQ